MWTFSSPGSSCCPFRSLRSWRCGSCCGSKVDFPKLRHWMRHVHALGILVPSRVAVSWLLQTLYLNLGTTPRYLAFYVWSYHYLRPLHTWMCSLAVSLPFPPYPPCLSLSLSILFSVSLSPSLSASLSLFLFLSVSLALSISPHLSLSLSLSLYPATRLCACLYKRLSAYLCICLRIYLFIHLSISPSVCLSVYLSVCLSVYLSI